MFYKVVIYKDYDGSKKLGHMALVRADCENAQRGGSSHLDSK